MGPNSYFTIVSGLPFIPIPPPTPPGHDLIQNRTLHSVLSLGLSVSVLGLHENHHKLGGMKQQKYILSLFWATSLKWSVGGPHSLEVEGSPSRLFLLLLMAAGHPQFPWLVAPSLTWPSLSLLLSLIRKVVMGLRAPGKIQGDLISRSLV